MQAVKSLDSYQPVQKLKPAPFLPMSVEEMKALGWDACDVILVTGDAYVDHPSFGMAVIGRLLEAEGFRVGIISQPNWKEKTDFMRLGKPRLFYGVTAGNMDSMINRYTAERRLRHDDAYTAGAEGGKRPDRAVIAYAQRCREAYKNVPLIIGGIEASLRRIAHYDYWSDNVRRSVLPDSKADMLLYGNAERALVEIAHRLADGEAIKEIGMIRGTAVMRSELPLDWSMIDSTDIDLPGEVVALSNPYEYGDPVCDSKHDSKTQSSLASEQQYNPSEPSAESVQVLRIQPHASRKDKICIRLPGYEQVKNDPVLYAHASRVMHVETNPGNARTLVQRHGNRDVWINPPPIPLTTPEMDRVFDLPYSRVPHPVYGNARIPAYEMIRFSVNIMRGCFGGCTFCSITEHEGRIIQNRSENSIIREVEAIRDSTPGFTGTISDLGGPTANMYRMACKSEKIESACRRLSCVFPGICSNLNTSHTDLIKLYRRARTLPGIKRVLIASGLRYDLAVENPEYIKELVTHHVGGYLKIAPEHTEEGPLNVMMKPGMGSYYRFKRLFDKYSEQAGKKQFLIPYFISAHPGTEDGDMLNLALWLKENNLKLDQVQNFIPSPMCNAATMYHTGKNPLKRISRAKNDQMTVPKGGRQRRLHKALLRYHDPENWPLIRETLMKLGRRDLIGGKNGLIPPGPTKTAAKNARHSSSVDRRSAGLRNSTSGSKLRSGQPHAMEARTMHTHGLGGDNASGTMNDRVKKGNTKKPKGNTTSIKKTGGIKARVNKTTEKGRYAAGKPKGRGGSAMGASKKRPSSGQSK